MKKIRILCLAFLFLSGQLYSSNGEYLHITLHTIPVGMFAIFSYVAGILYKYDTGDYAGIDIDFGTSGIYYDPSHGPNWWEYYCKPVKIGSIDGALIREFDFNDFEPYAYFVERRLDAYQVNALINKYITIQDSLEEKIQAFVSENFEGYHVICVHYRGTDKVTEAPRVSYERVLEAIKGHITANQLDDFKIFVATDEGQFLEYLTSAFGDAVVFYSTQRSWNNNPLHLNVKDQYLHGEEALIDCILLSKGDILIRTSSNLSRWSTYFNPDIPCISLNERY